VADVRHIHQVIVLAMSKASWLKQDGETRQAILEAAKYAEQWNRKFILDEDQGIQDQIKARGVAITKPDPTPFREATKSVYEEFYATPAGKDAKQVVDHIIALK
jgi:TRAP-type C4-dicarboxylate transport system substrate-binding protein